MPLGNDKEKPKPVADPQGPKRLEVPSYYAASAQVLISGNDATVLFTKPHPAMLPDGTVSPTPLREPVALIHLSIAGLKDLALTLTDIVHRAEQQTGQIISELSPANGSHAPQRIKRRSNGH